MIKVYYITLFVLLIFLGLGALYGGGLMIIDPSGEMLGLPISLIEKTPFSSYLWPGIILFIIFGLLPLLIIRPMIKKSYSPFMESLNPLSDLHWSWTFVIYISLGLIIWIQIQIDLIQETQWVHTFYTFYAVFMIALALMPSVRLRFKKDS